jgi:hypothetical protein
LYNRDPTILARRRRCRRLSLMKPRRSSHGAATKQSFGTLRQFLCFDRLLSYCNFSGGSGLEPVKGPTAMTKTALFTIVATLTLTPAIAETDIESTIESTNYLMPGCRELASGGNPSDFKSGFCAGTITTLRILSDAGRFGPLHSAERSVALGFCIPPNASNGQAVQVIVQYIDAQPARWQ